MDALDEEETSESYAHRSTVIVIATPPTPARAKAMVANRCGWLAWCRVLRNLNGAPEAARGEACDCGPGDCHVPTEILG